MKKELKKELEKLLEEASKIEAESKHEFNLDFTEASKVEEILTGQGLSEEKPDTLATILWNLTNHGKKHMLFYLNWEIRDYQEDDEDYLPTDFERRLMEFFYKYEEDVLLVISPRDDQYNFNNRRTIAFARFSEIVEDFEDVVLET